LQVKHDEYEAGNPPEVDQGEQHEHPGGSQRVLHRGYPCDQQAGDDGNEQTTGDGWHDVVGTAKKHIGAAHGHGGGQPGRQERAHSKGHV
jgi:hypothetical protein